MTYWLPRYTKLLVSSRLHREYDAASEVWHALRRTGISDNPEVHLIRRGRDWIRGLIAFVFEGNPLEAVLAIREYFRRNQWIMEYTERIYPIEYVTNDINEAVNFLANTAEKRIGSEKWKIHVFKHDAKLKRKKVIEKLAEVIDTGKVDLENPTWIITVHIIKDNIALAIVKEKHLIRKKDIKQPTTWKDLKFLPP